MNLRFKTSLHSKINIKWYTYICRHNIYSNTRLLHCWSCKKSYNCVYSKEYWMIYRRPGFLVIFWFVSSPIPFPPLPSASCLSFSYFLCVLSRSSFLTSRGWRSSQIIRQRESLVLYKLFNTPWCTACPFMWILFWRLHTLGLLVLIA